MNCHLLFVYGLLRKEASHEKSTYLSEQATFIEHAIFQGKLFRIEAYPGVTPSDNKTDTVIGEVYELPNDNILSNLDYFEGIGESFPRPYEYRRQICDVTLSSGSICQAWIYLYNRDLNEFEQISSGDFLNP
ncbi:MAG: gamma-glutamylcyclotransferase family protein [Bacteroidota bacterium]